MRKSTYLLSGIIITSLLACTSCDKIASELRAQFDSERPEAHTFNGAGSAVKVKAHTQPISHITAQNNAYENSNTYDDDDSSDSSIYQNNNGSNDSDNDSKKKPFYHKDRIKEYFNNGSDSNIYFLRGNTVSLMPVKGGENRYLLTMNGVGDNAIYFTDNQNVESGSINIDAFLEMWGKDKEFEATFIILRNSPKRIQKDVATVLAVSRPQFDQRSQSVEFIVMPKEEIRTKFVGNNLGSCAILVKF